MTRIPANRYAQQTARLILALALLGVTLPACGRYGPPRWSGGKPIPTASTGAIEPEPISIREIGDPPPESDDEEDDNEATP